MGAVIIVFEFIILAAVCVYLLHVFASFKKTPWYVTNDVHTYVCSLNTVLRYALASTWLGWLLCFSIVFLIPIDILNVCTSYFIDTLFLQMKKDGL